MDSEEIRRRIAETIERMKEREAEARRRETANRAPPPPHWADRDERDSSGR